MKKIFEKKETKKVVIAKKPETVYFDKIKKRIGQTLATTGVTTGIAIAVKFLPVPPLVKAGIIVADYVGSAMAYYKIINGALNDTAEYCRAMEDCEEELEKDDSSDDVKFEVVH